MLASHVIFGGYGFWLPNDPRGSWSDFVGPWELFRYGRATKTVETQSLAYREHDVAMRLAAKRALKRPAVKFSGVQARAIGRGLAEYARRSKLVILACTILPDHVHLVLGSHRLSPKQLVVQLKGAATRQLLAEGIHPFATDEGVEKCFARGEWKVYLDTEDEVLSAIQYVEKNPEKEGLPHQHWSFVTPAN